MCLRCALKCALTWCRRAACAGPDAWRVRLGEYVELSWEERLRLFVAGSVPETLIEDRETAKGFLRHVAPSQRSGVLTQALVRESVPRLAWCADLVRLEAHQPLVCLSPPTHNCFAMGSQLHCLVFI